MPSWYIIIYVRLKKMARMATTMMRTMEATPRPPYESQKALLAARGVLGAFVRMEFFSPIVSLSSVRILARRASRSLRVFSSSAAFWSASFFLPGWRSACIGGVADDVGDKLDEELEAEEVGVVFVVAPKVGGVVPGARVAEAGGEGDAELEAVLAGPGEGLGDIIGEEYPDVAMLALGDAAHVGAHYVAVRVGSLHLEGHVVIGDILDPYDVPRPLARSVTVRVRPMKRIRRA